MDTSYVATLGIFDGVHIGHAALLERAKEMAEKLDAEPMVLTFHPHPDSVVRGESVKLIITTSEREKIIREEFGISKVELIDFNERIMSMNWRDFADMLTERYNIVHFVVGYDFRFGYRGEGNGAALTEYCRERDLGCDIIPEVMDDGVGISSTYIRALLKEGKMERINHVLGRVYRLSDTIRHGRKIGRTLGVPTVNMCIPDGIVAPGLGVYATRVCVDGKDFDSVTNVGVRPTFDDSGNVTVESFIIGFDGDLYGKTLSVSFYKFLRPEKKFSSPDALAEQIKKDVSEAESYLKSM